MPFFIFIVFPVSVNGNCILSLIEAKKNEESSLTSLFVILLLFIHQQIISILSAEGIQNLNGQVAFYSGSIFPQTTVSSGQNAKDGYLKAVEREQKPVASGGESLGRQEGHGVSFTFIYLFIAKFTLRAGPNHILGNN